MRNFFNLGFIEIAQCEATACKATRKEHPLQLAKKLDHNSVIGLCSTWTAMHAWSGRHYESLFRSKSVVLKLGVFRESIP